MGWVILWALVLGFALFGVVQAVVTKGEMSRLLPDSRPRAILLASALGAASSSCSYAAVALARSLFRKGRRFCRSNGVPVRINLFLESPARRITSTRRKRFDYWAAGHLAGSTPPHCIREDMLHCL